LGAFYEVGVYAKATYPESEMDFPPRLRVSGLNEKNTKEGSRGFR